ncbi:uncharacterized protein LOC119302882 isoform X1 [Triticum dicoccoides]|uniref:uncharacterized protein LOC119302882 isoform X1 n=1 Tax=Triticum dicoccoides TaxID=85692 RepID=UPI0018901C5C|nr:uncharacterized protein LOC119302882 isoform X1 [Triticum dicoccoides]XP_037435825.1 uncharacterized protein LOC119302882 isoform X1 [Triticum dicoccoides]XP_037435827.1 uncharacterized protein LOC119302882 isoform X1 [Triticum dicoccoides]
MLQDSSLHPVHLDGVGGRRSDAGLGAQAIPRRQQLAPLRGNHHKCDVCIENQYWQSDAFRIGSQNFQPRLELACSLQFIVILILNESLPRLLGKIFFTFSNHYCSGILSGAHPSMVRGKPTTGHHLSRKQTERLHSQGTMKPTIHVN